MRGGVDGDGEDGGEAEELLGCCYTIRVNIRDGEKEVGKRSGRRGGWGTWMSIPRLQGGIFLGYRRCCGRRCISFV